MRLFPRIPQYSHPRRRAAAVLTAMALAAGVTPTAIGYANDLKDRQRQVEKKVKGAQEDLDHSSAALRKANERLAAARERLGQAQSELATARGKLAVAQEHDARMQAELEEAEAELVAAEEALEQGRVDRDAQRQDVADTVSEMYMEGDPSLIAFSSLLDATSTEDLTRRNGVRDVVIGQEVRAYDSLKAAEVLLKVQEEQVEEARDEVAAKRAAAAENLVLKQELEAEKEAARESVRTLVGERSAASEQARRTRARDVATLRRHQAQQERIERRLRQIALEELRKARRNAKGKPKAPKEKATGVLGHPSDGYVTSPFGYRTHPIYRYWGLHDGVDFGGGCGIPLRAAAEGRVTASYWSNVYGRRLVISHGVRGGVSLATIYNHASSYNVGVGARVSQGQVIGAQGDTGWSTACHLHFTVLANGNTVDPQNWL